MSDYTIIIPYHSNKNFLNICIDSIITTVPNEVEVIVVANNSDKAEVNIELPKRVKVIRVEENLGYSKAINLGVKNADGKYLIFSDSDTAYLSPSWFHNLTKFYLSKPNVGIASSKLLNTKTKRIIDFGMALSPYNNAHPFMDRPMDFELACKDRKVQMACSANMIIEKSLFLRMGMMDVELVNFYQDTDLCLRLKDQNKECWVVHNSIVFHQGSSTSVNRSPYKADIKGYFVAKNFHRMQQRDLGEYFELNYKWLNQLNQLGSQKYLMVDCSTVADREWFYEILKSYFDLYDIYEFGLAERDVDFISLLDQVGHNIMKLNTPLIYFVDRYISLQNNSIWDSFRDCTKDIVIDRNGNMVYYQDIYIA